MKQLTRLALALALALTAAAATAFDRNCAGAPAAPASRPIHGTWVATPEHTRFFDSPQQMARQLDEFKRMGIDTVFAAMWNQGRSMFPSETARRLTGAAIRESMQGRDPLAELIPLAHARGIKVYAWFEFGFASDFKGGAGHEILLAHPDWAALDGDGKPVIKNEFQWLDAFNPQVQDIVRELVLEAVRRYDIDGIQGDDRLPALPSEAGYNPATVAEYRAAHDGKAPPRDTRDPQWLAWRADKLTRFLERLHGEVKAIKPQLQISMAPSPFPWGYDEYLQDWPTWLRKGLVDSVSPQLYRYDIDGYRKELVKLAREQVCPQQRAQVFPGVLLALGKSYVASPELLRQMVEANRSEGLAGEVFFHSEGLAKRAALIGELYGGGKPVN